MTWRKMSSSKEIEEAAKKLNQAKIPTTKRHVYLLETGEMYEISETGKVKQI